jgi:transcription elongation GreA/GreB family factor
MLKSEILNLLAAELDTEVSRLKGANKAAAASATDSEFRAESKWDTGGLEASYLARGYARQFAQLTEQAQRLRSFQPRALSGKAAGVGALVECELGGFRSFMFLLPFCGGMELQIEDQELTVVTPDSPLGGALLNRRAGDAFKLPSGISCTVIRIE